MGQNKKAILQKKQLHFWGFISLSLIGVAVFVLLPFLGVISQSVTTVTTRQFVGLRHYRTVFSNQAFQLAAKNTLRFMLVCIPILVVIGLALAFVCSRLTEMDSIRALYLLPLALPTASVVLVWRMFFPKQDFMSLVICYVWKNLGYTICLWLAGIKSVSKEMLEAASVDGAGKCERLFYIFLPNLKGSLYTIVILSVLRSFQVYREAYLVAGAYPRQEIYLIQHIFNNWFVNLELDKLAAASVCIGVVFLCGNLLFQKLWDRE